MSIFVLDNKTLNAIGMEQNNQPQPPVFNQQQPQQAPQYPQFQPRVTVRPMMGFMEAVKTCLRKYFDFKGRARRSELWWFVLFAFLCSWGVSFIVSSVMQAMDLDYSVILGGTLIVSGIMSLVFLFPMLAAFTRRLHDMGRSGWWVAVFAVLILLYYASYAIVMWPIRDQMDFGNDPYAMLDLITNAVQASPVAATIMSFGSLPTFILGFVIFIFSLFDSKWGENKYGPSPKYQ